MTNTHTQITHETLADFITDIQKLAASYRQKTYRENLKTRETDLFECEWLLALSAPYEDLDKGAIIEL